MDIFFCFMMEPTPRWNKTEKNVNQSSSFVRFLVPFANYVIFHLWEGVSVLPKASGFNEEV